MYTEVFQCSPRTSASSRIGDFRKDPVRCTPILIYREFLNELAVASGFIRGESTVAATGVIQNISKFNSTDFDVATNPPRNGRFDKFKHFRSSGRPVAPRTPLSNLVRLRLTRNDGSDYQQLGDSRHPGR